MWSMGYGMWGVGDEVIGYVGHTVGVVTANSTKRTYLSQNRPLEIDGIPQQQSVEAGMYDWFTNVT